MTLFPDLEPVAIPAKDDPTLSAQRRMTLRQKAYVEAGLHPVTHGRLTTVDGATCGSCVHRVLVHWHNRTYAKCAFGIDPAVTPLDKAPRVAHSAQSDVRAWWPGCTDWEAKDA